MEELVRTMRTAHRSIYLIAIGLVLMGVSSLTIAYQKHQVDSALAGATQALVAAERQLTESQAEVSTARSWYKPAYFVDIDHNLRSAELHLGNEEHGARHDLELARAQQDWQQAVTYGHQSEAASTAALAEVDKAIAGLFNANNLRLEARNVLAGLTTQLDAEIVAASQALSQFESVRSRYLSKYMVPLGEKLQSSSQLLQESDQHLAAAQAILPDDSSFDQRGDPTLAIEELNAAKALVEKLATLTKQVTAGLDHQAEATSKAVTTTAHAASTIRDAKTYLANLEEERGFSPELALSKAYRSLATAEDNLSTAQTTLRVPVEGSKTDLPKAYQEALAAIASADDARQAGSEQVELADRAVDLLEQYQVAEDQFFEHQVKAIAALSILRANHHPLAWAAFAAHVSEAERLQTRAELSHKEAVRAASPAVQQYGVAIKAAESALSYLAEARTFCEQLVSTSLSLEAARLSWPDERNESLRVVQQALKTIESIAWSGRYDLYQARATIDQAASSMRTATDLASTFRWFEAVATAQDARRLAAQAEAEAHAEKARVDAADAAATRQAQAAAAAASAEATRQAEQLDQLNSNDDSGSDWSSPSYGGNDNNSWGSSDFGSDDGSWNDDSNDNGSWNDDNW